MAARLGMQVIHLDTKDWIELARGYYRRAPDLQRIAQEVVEKSQSNQAIFPLSITHFSETVRNLNQERRQRLAEYMMLVSQGWTILPAPQIIVPEIENACLKHLGQTGYDLQALAIKKGLSHMAGAEGTLVDKDPRHPTPEEEKRRILEKIDGPWGLLKLMQIGFPQSEIEKLQADSMATAEELEKIRKSWQVPIKDNNLLRRAVLADYLIREVGPRLIKFLSRVLPDPKAFLEELSTDQETIIRFFQSMPTSYCDAQLTLYRDMQMKRKIQPNDLHDIMSLSIAIPYSDVVVTERMWQTAIIQTKIDKLRPTVILKSVDELAPILQLK
jgi:hypothetical protein